MTIDVSLHFWALDAPGSTVEDLARHLSPDETARAARFVFDRDRIAHVLGRGRLREILGARTGTAPAALRFDYGAHGKPALAGGPFFNLSHSGGLACLAISETADLGCDIEAFRFVEEGVAERFFAPAEHAARLALPEAERQAAFFRIWTRKEAVVKAIGDGLSIPLDAFDVTIDAGTPPRMTRLDPAHGVAAEWRLAHLDLGPAMVGALAIRAEGRPVAITLAECPEDVPFHHLL